MLASELINQMIPPLKLSDSAQVALHWMQEFRVTQLPVIEGTLYKGIIHEATIIDSQDAAQAISSYRLDLPDIAVNSDTHFYELIQLAAKNGLQLIPITDHEGNYMGVVSVSEAATVIAQLIATQGPGAILVLYMKNIDYSMAEVARLIESNDTKIMSSAVSNDSIDPNYVRLTLKLNRTDLTRVIATLERFDYRIVAQFQETDTFNNDKERLDLLMRFLNI